MPEDIFDSIKALQARMDAQDRDKNLNTLMSKHGGKFKNDSKIGFKILEQLEQAGVDVSAADEVVQDILENVRQETLAQKKVLDELLEKISNISEATSSVMNEQNVPADTTTPMAPIDPNAVPAASAGDASLGSAGSMETPPPAPAAPAMTPPADVSPAPAAPPVQDPNAVVSDEELKDVMEDEGTEDEETVDDETSAIIAAIDDLIGELSPSAEEGGDTPEEDGASTEEEIEIESDDDDEEEDDDEMLPLKSIDRLRQRGVLDTDLLDEDFDKDMSEDEVIASYLTGKHHR